MMGDAQECDFCGSTRKVEPLRNLRPDEEPTSVCEVCREIQSRGDLIHGVSSWEASPVLVALSRLGNLILDRIDNASELSNG